MYRGGNSGQHRGGARRPVKQCTGVALEGMQLKQCRGRYTVGNHRGGDKRQAKQSRDGDGKGWTAIGPVPKGS